jgi:hypothetical protein
MTGDFTTEQLESGRAYGPATFHPQFKYLWNLADIQALNRRERVKIAQAPEDFQAPNADCGPITRDTIGRKILPDAFDLLRALQEAEKLAVTRREGVVETTPEKFSTESQFAHMQTMSDGDDRRSRWNDFFRKQAEECKLLAQAADRQPATRHLQQSSDLPSGTDITNHAKALGELHPEWWQNEGAHHEIRKCNLFADRVFRDMAVPLP